MSIIFKNALAANNIFFFVQPTQTVNPFNFNTFIQPQIATSPRSVEEIPDTATWVLQNIVKQAGDEPLNDEGMIIFLDSPYLSMGSVNTGYDTVAINNITEQILPEVWFYGKKEENTDTSTSANSEIISPVQVNLSGPQFVNEGSMTTNYTITLAQPVAAGSTHTIVFTYSGTAEDGTDYIGVAQVF